jgi:hypothetical protein
MHTKAMEDIVLKVFSSVLHGLSMQGNLGKATLATQAFHMENQFKECQAFAKVKLKPAFDTLMVSIKQMPCFLGPLLHLLVLRDPLFQKNQGPRTSSSFSFYGQVTHNTYQAPQNTVGEAGGVCNRTALNSFKLVPSSSFSSKLISKLIGNPVRREISSVNGSLKSDVARDPHHFEKAIPSDTPPPAGIGNPTPKQAIAFDMFTMKPMESLDNPEVVADINGSANRR